MESKYGTGKKRTKVKVTRDGKTFYREQEVGSAKDSRLAKTTTKGSFTDTPAAKRQAELLAKVEEREKRRKANEEKVEPVKDLRGNGGWEYKEEDKVQEDSWEKFKRRSSEKRSAINESKRELRGGKERLTRKDLEDTRKLVDNKENPTINYQEYEDNGYGISVKKSKRGIEEYSTMQEAYEMENETEKFKDAKDIRLKKNEKKAARDKILNKPKKKRR